MFRTYDAVNGIPPRIYRSPKEIRSDISKIKQRISEVNEMLNIRSILTEILTAERASSPESLIPELENAIKEARDALKRLSELESELSLLEEELGDVKYLFGI